MLKEVAAEFGRVFSGKTQSVLDTLEYLSSVTGRNLNTLPDTWDRLQEQRQFVNKLELDFDAARAKVLGFPDCSHEELVERATSRIRPFDDKGSGYRDTLIWFNVLGLVTQVEGEIVLVAKDKDFRDKQNNLHSHLVDDLAKLGQSGRRVSLVETLSALMDNNVRPELDQETWETPLETLSDLGFDVQDAIPFEILREYSGMELSPRQLGLPEEYGSLNLESVESISKITVADARKLPVDKFLVRVLVDLAGEFSVYVRKADWYMLADDQRPFLADFDWNDSTTRGTVILPILCELDLFIDVTGSNQHQLQIAWAQFAGESVE